MSTAAMVAVIGLIMTFFGGIIAALVGYATIRKQPGVLLGVVLTLGAGALLVACAIAVILIQELGPGTQVAVERQSASQDRACREERVELGPYEYDSYKRTLAEDEAIVGDAVDVEDRGLHCVVFWAKGPRTVTFSMLNGAWDRYSGVASQSQLEELVQARYNYLQDHHYYCKNVAVPVVELGTP